MKRTIKVGDVWHTKRDYRRVIVVMAFLRGRVVYENRYGAYRGCLLTTFRRWVRERKARRGQRHRRRELALS